MSHNSAVRGILKRSVSVIQVKLFSPADLIVCFLCASQIQNQPLTPHKHWVAILITLSCVFVLQHTGKVWTFSPFSATMK